MTNWYNFDQKSKKALILIMERLKKPFKLTAESVLDLSLETFKMILSKAYSLLAVLINYY